MRISVGPAPSHWGRDKLETFYHNLAQSPVDYVYIGETVCLNRSCLSFDFLDKIRNQLTWAGKEVYVSSLVLIKNQEQQKSFDKLAQKFGRIEINSPAFLALARHYHAVTGMFLNVCNSTAADILAKYMIKKIVLPCELSFQSIACIAKKHTVRTEVVVYGHIPVAVAGTCHTARSFGRKDNECKQLCRQYPEGMLLEADNQPLFRIDGPQTLSAATYCLVEYLPQLEKAGVDTVRILPQYNHTDRIVHIFKDVLTHRRDSKEALEELNGLSGQPFCNGWFHAKAGWIYESLNTSVDSASSSPYPCIMSEKHPDRRPCQSTSDPNHYPTMNALHDGSVNQIIYELNQLVEILNNDQKFVEQIAGFKGVKLVLAASDTGREFLIEVGEHGVRVKPYGGQSFDVKIQATEQVFVAVFLGQMDEDAAFFAGKLHVYGSLFTAFRIKNKLLSLLRSHLLNRLKAAPKTFKNYCSLT